MSVMTEAYSTEQILAMGTEEFRNLVDRDLRKDLDPEISAQLRSPEVIERFYRMVVTMVKSVEGNLGARREVMKEARATGVPSSFAENARPFKTLADQEQVYSSWRAKTLRFKSRLEADLIEIGRIRHEARIRGGARFKRAIAQHRNSFPADQEPSDADVELWEQLDE